MLMVIAAHHLSTQELKKYSLLTIALVITNYITVTNAALPFELIKIRSFIRWRTFSIKSMSNKSNIAGRIGETMTNVQT